MKTKVSVSNVLFCVMGFLAFVVALVVFGMIASGVESADISGRGGVVLFISFVLCMGLALWGLMIMALTQISATLSRIEKMLNEKMKENA